MSRCIPLMSLRFASSSRGLTDAIPSTPPSLKGSPSGSTREEAARFTVDPFTVNELMCWQFSSGGGEAGISVAPSFPPSSSSSRNRFSVTRSVYKYL